MISDLLCVWNRTDMFQKGDDRSLGPVITFCQYAGAFYQPSTYAKISGATIVASLSTMKRGVVGDSLPQVIFSLGTAPEYEP